jgi:hypothetical protein
MHPVAGKVEIKDGDVGILKGSHVELMQDGNPDVRPNGKIQDSGAFLIETLHQGKVLAGAPEGKYKVRIILGDESDESVPKRKGDPIHKKYFDFATSGLAITVPGGDYKITVSKK